MQKLLDFFKTLSDQTRLRIMVLLSRKEFCVCELCSILQLPQPKVSAHLAKLRDMGYVQDERQGQWIFYELNIHDHTILEIIKIIAASKCEILEDDWRNYLEKEKNNSLCERKNKKNFKEA
ncbi:MAG: HTH-type transcriptional repressor AseR [Pelotomaculum sp. PtaB.Bin104]|nr:MAG: HTH-type transcriptional repressor AseR [Pelotomaculum sp. PtaB.Bin104]